MLVIILYNFFTPFRNENAQSVSPSSLINAPFGGVLNEKRCNKSPIKENFSFSTSPPIPDADINDFVTNLSKLNANEINKITINDFETFIYFNNVINKLTDGQKRTIQSQLDALNIVLGKYRDSFFDDFSKIKVPDDIDNLVINFENVSYLETVCNFLNIVNSTFTLEQKQKIKPFVDYINSYLNIVEPYYTNGYAGISKGIFSGILTLIFNDVRPAYIDNEFNILINELSKNELTKRQNIISLNLLFKGLSFKSLSKNKAYIQKKINDLIQPTTLGPTTLQPTTLQPTTLQPTTLQPTTLQPTTLGPLAKLSIFDIIINFFKRIFHIK